MPSFLTAMPYCSPVSNSAAIWKEGYSLIAERRDGVVVHAASTVPPLRALDISPMSSKGTTWALRGALSVT